MKNNENELAQIKQFGLQMMHARNFEAARDCYIGALRKYDGDIELYLNEFLEDFLVKSAQIVHRVSNIQSDFDYVLNQEFTIDPTELTMSKYNELNNPEQQFTHLSVSCTE